MNERGDKMENIFSAWGIEDKNYYLGEEIEESLKDVFEDIRKRRAFNQMKVLRAFQNAKFSESDLAGSSGYGYDDRGREKLEEVYAEVFGGESALVRWQISSGTHALALCLFGILRPGDHLLSVAGDLYDTLQDSLGHRSDEDRGSLRDFNIDYSYLELLEDASVDMDAIADSINDNTKMLWIQRSRGYKNRPAISIANIERIVRIAKEKKEDIIVCVDNCYGEFVETKEPLEVGADLIAGSLIKNPGGGIAQTGGYVVGKKRLVDLAAYRLTAPGVGGEVGATMGVTRQLAQGLFQAPHSVAECLQGISFTAALMENEGFRTSPSAWEERSDIVQVLEFEEAEDLIAFCKSIQASSPIDSYVSPVPGDMPGYDAQVIMAAGGFVQGSSMELSADGPIRKPYQAFMQGGIVYENIKLAALAALQAMQNRRENDPLKRRG